MDVETAKCEVDKNLWHQFVCWLHLKVEPLCEKNPDGSFRLTNKLGVGAWRLLSYGTECHCCHGLRILVLVAAWWAIGVFLPFLLGGLLLLAITLATLYIGDQFAKKQ